jgi:cytochrome c-type biogenesis protein
VLGCAFAAGWSPCIGPVLASILTLTASGHTAWSGAALLLLYSLGLGVPFVLVAGGTGRPRWLPWMRRHSSALERTGGLLLAGVGVLLLSGAWERLLQPLQRAMAGMDWPPV